MRLFIPARIRGRRPYDARTEDEEDKEGTLIATVDIGATTNTGYCTTVDGRDVKVFKFGNAKEGFEKFWHMVVAAKTGLDAPRSSSAMNRPAPTPSLSSTTLRISL